MFEELAAAYTRLDDDAELRMGVMHAFGGHFTAGLDLPAFSAHARAYGGRPCDAAPAGRR